MAMESIKPPMYKKIYGCAYELVVSVIPNPPETGNKTIGSREVTAMGIASVIHQMDIQAVEARIDNAWGLSPAGLKNNNRLKKLKGPATKPKDLRETLGFGIWFQFSWLEFIKIL